MGDCVGLYVGRQPDAANNRRTHPRGQEPLLRVGSEDSSWWRFRQFREQTNYLGLTIGSRVVNNAEVKGSITPMDSRGWGGVVGWVRGVLPTGGTQYN